VIAQDIFSSIYSREYVSEHIPVPHAGYISVMSDKELDFKYELNVRAI